jgi:hypothetical protein
MDGTLGAPRGGATLGEANSARVDGWMVHSGCAANRLIIGSAAARRPDDERRIDGPMVADDPVWYTRDAPGSASLACPAVVSGAGRPPPPGLPSVSVPSRVTGRVEGPVPEASAVRCMTTPSGAGTGETRATWMGVRAPAANQLGALLDAGARVPAGLPAFGRVPAPPVRVARRSAPMPAIALMPMPSVVRRGDPSGPAARISPGDPGTGVPIVPGMTPGPPVSCDRRTLGANGTGKAGRPLSR